MVGLFKQETPQAKRVYRVENLNPEKSIISSLSVSKNRRRYSVVLCLPYKTKRSLFHSEALALREMEKYRELYKQRKAE